MGVHDISGGFHEVSQSVSSWAVMAVPVPYGTAMCFVALLWFFVAPTAGRQLHDAPGLARGGSHGTAMTLSWHCRGIAIVMLWQSHRSSVRAHEIPH